MRCFFNTVAGVEEQIGSEEKQIGSENELTAVRQALAEITEDIEGIATLASVR